MTLLSYLFAPTLIMFSLYSSSVLIVMSILFVLVLIKLSLFNSKTNNNKLPPGPKPWPLVGNLPEMIINTVIKKKPKSKWIHDLMDIFQTDIASIRLGNVHVIPVRSPEIARELLQQNDAVFSSRPLNMTSDLTSRGFLTTIMAPEGGQWRKMRKMLVSHVVGPAMKLERLRERRDEVADDLVRFVHGKCEGGGALVNVREAAWRFCGGVMRSMLFGRRCFGGGGSGFEEEEHMDAACKVVANVFALSPSDFNPIFRILDLDGHGKVVKDAMRIMNKYQDPIVEERVKQWRDGDKDEPEDMLDLFILAKDSTGQRLSVQEIKAQCAEIFFATVLDPASVVEWTLAEMINQHEILHMAVEEIDTVIGKERLVQEFDIPSLRYIRACVTESFRLHPLFSFLPPHASTEDTFLSGYFIPKGSNVIISRWDLGRNPKVWDQPLKFNPERHLRDDGAQVKFIDGDFRFISFGGGRRGCIGVALASVMVMMLLTRLLQGFSWEVPPEKEKIDLTESSDPLLLLDQPLHALVKPRLLASKYPI